jgi:hypothetical protein
MSTQIANYVKTLPHLTNTEVELFIQRERAYCAAKMTDIRTLVEPALTQYVKLETEYNSMVFAMHNDLKYALPSIMLEHALMFSEDAIERAKDELALLKKLVPTTH